LKQIKSQSSINSAIPSINQSIIQTILGGLSTGTTARSTGDSQQVVGKRLPEQVCYDDTTACRQWFCWCRVFREVIPCLRASDRKKLCQHQSTVCW